MVRHELASLTHQTLLSLHLLLLLLMMRNSKRQEVVSLVTCHRLASRPGWSMALRVRCCFFEGNFLETILVTTVHSAGYFFFRELFKTFVHD